MVLFMSVLQNLLTIAETLQIVILFSFGIVWNFLPSNGDLSDDWGVMSERRSMKTEKASNIDIPMESFSPESTGTTNVSAESNDKTTVGTIMLST